MMNNPPAPENVYPTKSITLTVGIFFDGTGNNRNNSNALRTAYSQCTSHEQGNACYEYEKRKKRGIGNESWQNGLTNISRIFELYQQSDIPKDGHIESQIKIYINGVGTTDGESDSILGKALGSSLIRQLDGVVTKTDEALSAISIELARFIKLNSFKVTITKLQFDVFGFSRGAAAARHFTNRVMNQDKAIVAAINYGLNMVNYLGKPEGEVRFLGLFDTVAAIGNFLNLYNISGRSNPGISLEIRPSAAQKVFQISAMHECRHNFSLNSIKGMWPELALPGVHSDIGGGYNEEEDEISMLTMPKFNIIGYTASEMETEAYRETEKMRQALYSIPALKYIIPHSQVETKMISWPLVKHNKMQDFTFDKKVGAAVFMTRKAVPNGWEKVSMRVMLDAALDAGVIFSSIPTSNKEFTLPSELIPLCEKAILQGRSVRLGLEPDGFTSEEMGIIGRYLHCSANWNIGSDLNLWVNPSDGDVFRKSNYAPTNDHLLVWPMAPGKGWVRTVWLMDDQQQLERRERETANKLDNLF